MNKLRVCLIALSVRGAMGQYVQALAAELTRYLQLYLFVPKHFSETDVKGASVVRFKSGNKRLIALLRFTNLLAPLQIWSQIESLRPDVIHIFNGEGYPWTLVWAWKSNKRDFPLLVTVHDPEPHPGNFWEAVNGWFRGYVLKRSISVHVHSNCFIGAVKRQGAKEVWVIPHGSFAPRFLQHRKPWVKREPFVLFFGRLEAYKGLNTLVEAGLLLNGKLRVVIAGPGRLPNRLMCIIQRHSRIFELHNRYLDDEEVADFFQRASVCVLPYHQASQSSVPLIAAAFGVPVVGTAVGAFVEDIPRVNGLLVPPGDPKALASAIMDALDRAPVYPADLEFPALAQRFVEWYEHCVNF